MGTRALHPRPIDVDEAFRELARAHDLDVRNDLVEHHLWLVEPIVRRLSRHGVLAEDLRQVAIVGLIDAVGRFDPDRGVTFRTFASRTVEGVCKRHLRDRSWMVRPPRRLHDDHLRLRQATEELTHRHGRTPTPRDLGAHLGWTVERVLEAMEADHLRHVDPIDMSPNDDTPSEPADPTPHDLDPEDRILLMAALDRLPAADRQVVVLRYWADWSQSELAALDGVTQSYMSRRLRRAVEELRDQLEH